MNSLAPAQPPRSGHAATTLEAVRGDAVQSNVSGGWQRRPDSDPPAALAPPGTLPPYRFAEHSAEQHHDNKQGDGEVEHSPPTFAPLRRGRAVDRVIGAEWRGWCWWKTFR